MTIQYGIVPGGSSQFTYSISMSSTNYALLLPSHKYDNNSAVYSYCFENDKKTITGITNLKQCGTNDTWHGISNYIGTANYIVIGY